MYGFVVVSVCKGGIVVVRVVVDFLFEVFFVKEDLVVIEFEGKMIGSMD